MVLLNYIIYTAFCILLQLLEVKSQTTLRPGLREAHTAALINDKLYILGGSTSFTGKTSPKETFLYLDCSAPFNTNELKWIDLSNNNIIPPHSAATVDIGGASNNTLFIYGGESLSSEPMSLVYTFNTTNNKWSIPIITGVPPNGKVWLTSAVDYNGLMYLYGGATSEIGSDYTNDTFILDTINLNWKKANSINAPSSRVNYGAVFLPDKSIIYIGGYNNNFGMFTLNTVYLYDTISNIWTTKITGGSVPSARASFSSVLGLDGQRVIIFGGYGDYTIYSSNSLYVLNLNNFSWYIPKITGTIPLSRGHHKTVVIGKYMVVTFGEGYTRGAENDVLLLDISNNDEYIWTTNFVPQPPVSSSPITSSPIPSSSTSSQPPSSPVSNTQPNYTGIIVGAVIGSTIGGILLSIGGFLLYKRHKNIRERSESIPTPGEASQIPTERITYYQDQQALPPFQVQNHGQGAVPYQGPIYNHGRETVPNIQGQIYNHGRETVPNIQGPIYNHGQEAVPNIQIQGF